jgi:IS30 family transposase
VIAQWVVPQSLRPLLHKLAHDDISAAHAGVQGTTTRLCQKYYWLGMNQDVREYVASCIICQQRKAAPSNKWRQITVPPKRLWQRMTMDLLECRAVTELGNKYVAAFIESVTGYCYLFAIKNKKAEDVAECIQKEILDMSSIEELGSDNGGEFNNDNIAHLCT